MSGADHPTPAAAPGGVDPAGTETIPVSRRAAMELRLLALERSLASGERPDVSEVLDDLLAAYGGGPKARATAAAGSRAGPPSRPWLVGACALLLGAMGTVVALSTGPERPAAVANPPRLILPAGPTAARGGTGAEGGPRRQEAAAGSAERAPARSRGVCVYRGAAERSCATFE